MEGAGAFFLLVIFIIAIWAVAMSGCVRQRRNMWVMNEGMQYNYPTQGQGMMMQ